MTHEQRTEKRLAVAKAMYLCDAQVYENPSCDWEETDAKLRSRYLCRADAAMAAMGFPEPPTQPTETTMSELSEHEKYQKMLEEVRKAICEEIYRYGFGSLAEDSNAAVDKAARRILAIAGHAEPVKAVTPGEAIMREYNSDTGDLKDIIDAHLAALADEIDRNGLCIPGETKMILRKLITTYTK